MPSDFLTRVVGELADQFTRDVEDAESEWLPPEFRFIDARSSRDARSGESKIELEFAHEGRGAHRVIVEIEKSAMERLLAEDARRAGYEDERARQVARAIDLSVMEALWGECEDPPPRIVISGAD